MVLLVVALAVVVKGSHVTAPPAEVPQRVVFVVYADRTDDTRGWQDFEKLKYAVSRFNPNVLRNTSLEFAQAVVGQSPSIAELLDGIVRSGPTVIIATSHDVLEAAERKTTSIPILFVSHEDPVDAGDVRSIALPGLNRTGFTFNVPMLQKAAQLLTAAYPHVRHIGVVIDRLSASGHSFLEEINGANGSSSVDIHVFVAENKQELRSVLASPEARSVDAWYVPAGPALWYDRDTVLRLMAHTSKPVLYDRTFLVTEGGLMSYEAKLDDPFSIWAHQLVLLLNGVDAATIPVERPSRFELAVNLDAIAANPRLTPTKNFIKRADVLVGAQDVRGRQPGRAP